MTAGMEAQILPPDDGMDELQYLHQNNPSGLSSGDDCTDFNFTVSQSGCDDYTKNAPVDPSRMPIKKIRVIFHVFQKDDGSRIFQNTPTDLALLNSVIPELNSMFAGVDPLSNPTPSCPPNVILDSRIRFEHQNTYFYTDSDAWCAAHHRNDNPHGCDLFDSYVTGNTALTSVQKENAIHVFVLGCRRDAFGMGPEIFHLGGYASGIPSNETKFIVVKGWYNLAVENAQPWRMTQEIATNLAHEFGHCFGLLHTFSGDLCCDTHPGSLGSTNNFMDYSYGRGVSECQMARMHYFLEGKSSSDVHKAVMTDYCSEDTGHEVIIPNGVTEIWEVDRKFNSDIKVETGGQLIIKCTVGLPTDGEIYVERGARLFIDGGKITHNKTRWFGCTSGKWGGIKVAGNTNYIQTPGMQSETYPLDPNGPGFVIIKNGTLEHSNNAISTNSKGIPWPTSEDYWGGFIYAENSSFIDNKRSVEFMKYNHTSYSGFFNCDFLNIDGSADTGVTDWATHGITFDECHFEGLKTGILAYDAGIYVVSSEFIDMERGVETFATFPLSTNLEIGSTNPLNGNFFDNNVVGIQSTAAVNLFIWNNTFLDYTLAGIAINGNSHYRIVKNNFNTPDNNPVVAIDLDQTGNKFNDIRCNKHYDNYWSIDIRGANDNTHFYDQNFDGIYDILLTNYLTTPGILPNQGSIVDPRYNYFTIVTGNLQHINTFGSTNQFDYWYPLSAPVGSSLIPKCSLNNFLGCIAPNNFFTFKSRNDGFSECPTETGGGGPREGLTEDPFDDCLTIQCLNDLDNQIDGIDTVGLSDDEKSIYLSLLTERNRVLWKIINLLVKEKNYSEAENILENEDDEIAAMNLFGLKVLQNKYSEAESILSTLNTSGEDNSFVDVQKINLRRLNQLDEFRLSQDEENLLFDIALNDGHGAGHARSILSLHSGMRFDPELPDIEPEVVFPDAEVSSVDLISEDILIFPNPAENQINILFDGIIEGSQDFTIYNALGAEVYHLDIIKNERLTLNVQSFGKGIYFGVVRKNGAKINQVKFVVQ